MRSRSFSSQFSRRFYAVRKGYTDLSELLDQKEAAAQDNSSCGDEAAEKQDAPEDDRTTPSTASQSNSALSWRRTVEHVIFRAMRKHLLVPQRMGDNGTFLELANLPDLYKVFERCWQSRFIGVSRSCCVEVIVFRNWQQLSKTWGHFWFCQNFVLSIWSVFLGSLPPLQRSRVDCKPLGLVVNLRHKPCCFFPSRLRDWRIVLCFPHFLLLTAVVLVNLFPNRFLLYKLPSQAFVCRLDVNKISPCAPMLRLLITFSLKVVWFWLLLTRVATFALFRPNFRNLALFPVGCPKKISFGLFQASSRVAWS